jgi:hypothetical protein
MNVYAFAFACISKYRIFIHCSCKYFFPSAIYINIYIYIYIFFYAKCLDLGL